MLKIMFIYLMIMFELLNSLTFIKEVYKRYYFQVITFVLKEFSINNLKFIFYKFG